MASAAQRTRSSRSPNQITEASATQRRVEVEDQQRERDPDAQEGHEHGQVEERVGDAAATEQRSVGQIAQRLHARRPRHRPRGQEDAARTMRADPRAPGDEGQAGDAGRGPRTRMSGPSMAKEAAATSTIRPRRTRSAAWRAERHGRESTVAGSASAPPARRPAAPSRRPADRSGRGRRCALDQLADQARDRRSVAGSARRSADLGQVRIGLADLRLDSAPGRARRSRVRR